MLSQVPGEAGHRKTAAFAVGGSTERRARHGRRNGSLKDDKK